MSHVASVSVHVTDLDALKAACQALGLEFCEGQKTWRWYGSWQRDYNAEDAAYRNGIDPSQYGKSEHAIRHPQSVYEIGVVPHPSGKGYALVYDFYGPGQRIATTLGRGLEKLKQQYTVQAATRQAKKQGFRVQQQVGTDGKIRLTCMR